MGYTTYFNGKFKTNKAMPDELVKRMEDFAAERHGSYTNSQCNCPGIWCQWVPVGNDAIAWDEGEKFYEYTDWLLYIIEKFMKPNDIKLSGDVEWQGEDADDFGVIRCIGNAVYVLNGVRGYSEPVLIKPKETWNYGEV